MAPRTRKGSAVDSFETKVKRADLEDGPFFYREGTSDEVFLQQVLTGRSDYTFPKMDASNILDIGANIGAVSILLSRLYPKAMIFAYEPDAMNFELLSRNTANRDNIQIYNVALGDLTAMRRLYASDNSKNSGGFSFFDAGVSKHSSKVVQCIKASDALKSNGLTQVDIIKIDCEGAEYEIIKDLYFYFPLHATKCIVGELHGKDDWKVLNYLSDGFDIAVQKNLGSRVFPFHARRIGLS